MPEQEFKILQLFNPPQIVDALIEKGGWRCYIQPVSVDSLMRMPENERFFNEMLFRRDKKRTRILGLNIPGGNWATEIPTEGEVIVFPHPNSNIFIPGSERVSLQRQRELIDSRKAGLLHGLGFDPNSSDNILRAIAGALPLRMVISCESPSAILQINLAWEKDPETKGKIYPGYVGTNSDIRVGRVVETHGLSLLPWSSQHGEREIPALCVIRPAELVEPVEAA